MESCEKCLARRQKEQLQVMVVSSLDAYRYRGGQKLRDTLGKMIKPHSKKRMDISHRIKRPQLMIKLN